ncbi:MAG: redoxin domain-containing protein, partial [Planctomycetes bacterium]|nr:redoxin domain-containing protein [Planctomycetota bacterium]
MRSLTLLALAVLLPAAAPDDDSAPDFTLAEVSGKTVTLSSLKGKKAVVLVFAGIECPRSTASEARLGDLARKYGEQGVAFYVINSNWSETVEAIQERVTRVGFPIPVLKDTRNKVADLYRIDTQPTALLIDAEMKIRYRGLIDDHKSEELVKHPYLKDALEALLAGKAVENPETKAVGCALQKLGAGSVTSDGTTYAKHVARILNDNCVT